MGSADAELTQAVTPAPASAPLTPAQLSPLEHGLRLFTEVQPGEGLTAVVMFANVFLILCAYYFVKPLRDGWIAVSAVAGLSSVEVKAYTSFAQSLVLIGAVTMYARLVTRTRRPRSSASASLRSRVTPGVSATSAVRRPTSRLNSALLPTFGRPAITTTGSIAN